MKIALVGSQTHSVSLAPFEDKSFDDYRQGLPQWWPTGGVTLPDQWRVDDFEIWACSPGAAAQLRRATRFFELHRWEPGKPWLPPIYCEFLKQFKGPVYTGGPIPELPTHVVYPIDQVEHEFSSYFLTNSLSLMAALAILEIEEDRKRRANGEAEDIIGFWGVDMTAAEEYARQRLGVQFFIYEALRRGIGVYVPPESDLLRPTPVYGLSEWGHAYIKLTQKAREYNARRDEIQKRLQEDQVQLASLAGAMEDLNYMVNIWTSPYGLASGTVIHMRKDDGDRARRDPRQAGEDAAGQTGGASKGRGHSGQGEGARAVAAEPRVPD